MGLCAALKVSYIDEVRASILLPQQLLSSWGSSPFSWTFSTSRYFHAATSGIRDTAHHPYISTCFVWETFLLPFFFYFLWSANCMTDEHEPCTYKLALKVHSHKHTAKYVINYDCLRVHYPTHQSGLLPFQQESNLTVRKSLIIIDTAATK